MKQFLIWGTDVRAKEWLEWYKRLECLKENEIKAFIDSSPQKQGKEFYGYPVIAPQDIAAMDYDAISIWVMEKSGEIYKQLTENMNIAADRIADIFMPFKQKIYEKYSATDDFEIKKIMDIMRTSHGLRVFYYDELSEHDVLNEVFYDEKATLHYCYFEGKKLYLKRSYNQYIEKNGKKYVGDFWQEQDKNSPHLYESEEIKVEEGDVLVDAGACEGNFSLHHIDRVSKLYLIEYDKEWVEALQYTFAPYKEKVVICDKFLCERDSDTVVCLDTLVEEKVDYIKMDIEGAETSALKGARRILSENRKIKCAVSAYHQHGDEEDVRNLLLKYDFAQIEASKGYMLFLYDRSVLEAPELRRGIVRGRKGAM